MLTLLVSLNLLAAPGIGNPVGNSSTEVEDPPPPQRQPDSQSSFHQTAISLTNTWTANYTTGDNFTLPCNVYGRVRHDQYVQFVRLIDDRDYVISNGRELTRSAKATGRYLVKIQTLDDRTLVATLYIFNITSQDGGRLGCKLGPDKYGVTAHTGREITVYAPVERIRMHYKTSNGSYQEIPDGGTVTLLNTYHRVSSGVTCEVTVGGTVRPDIRVFIDRKDVTDRFQVSTNHSRRNNGWLLERGYTITLTYEIQHPDRRADGKWMECRAKVPRYPGKKMAVKMNVTYPPMFSCPDKVYTWTGYNDVIIACNVSGNPAPSHATYWWRQRGEERVLVMGMRTGDFTTDMKVISSNTVEYTLMLREVKYSHFHAYVLDVDNGMGLRQYTITLIEGLDPGRGAALHTGDAALVVCMSLVSSYVTHGGQWT